METNLIFDTHVAEYEKWCSDFPFVFQSAVEALRRMLPAGESPAGIEVGLGTGRFSQALGIKKGVEPSASMRMLASSRGIEVVDGHAEHLPYDDEHFDFVLMSFCISYFNDLHVAFTEAHRVLKKNGVLVLGFLDRNSIIGKQYEDLKDESTFFKTVTVYTVDKVLFELSRARFRNFQFSQTLFRRLEDTNSFEPPKAGYGEGAFVVIQAHKG